MTCPKCGGDTSIKGSVREPTLIVRRRVCVNCANIFFTTESAQPDSRSIFYHIETEQHEEKLRREVDKYSVKFE